MSSKCLSILQNISWCFEDPKKALASAWEKNALRDLNRASRNSLARGWLHRIQAIKRRSVRDVRQLCQDTRTASTVYIVALDSAHLALVTPNTLIWTNLRLLSTSDHQCNYRSYKCQYFTNWPIFCNWNKFSDKLFI